jgi:hypothetical protein
MHQNGGIGGHTFTQAGECFTHQPVGQSMRATVDRQVNPLTQGNQESRVANRLDEWKIQG